MESGEWRCKFVSARLNDTNGKLGLEEARLFFFMGILGMADLKQSSFGESRAVLEQFQCSFQRKTALRIRLIDQAFLST